MKVLHAVFNSCKQCPYAFRNDCTVTCFNEINKKDNNFRVIVDLKLSPNYDAIPDWCKLSNL